MMKSFKKIGIILLCLSVISSCKRTFEYDENASIEGVWQPIKVRASGTYYGVPFVKTEDTSTCQRDSKITYKTDLSGSEITYDDETGTCINNINRTFTYQFDVTAKSLTQTYSDGNSKTVQVLSITSNTLVIKTKKLVNGVMADLEITNTKIQ